MQARPADEELVLQGSRLCEQGKYKAAVAIYKQALKEYNSAHAAYNLGVTYEVNLRDMKQAIRYYHQFLTLEPYSNDAKQVRGWIEEIKAAHPYLTAQKPKSLEKLPPHLKKKVTTDLKHAQDFYIKGNA